VESRDCGPGKGLLWRRESVALKRACCGDEEEEYSCCCCWWWWWCCLSLSVREQGLLQAGWQVSVFQAGWQFSLSVTVLSVRSVALVCQLLAVTTSSGLSSARVVTSFALLMVIGVSFCRWWPAFFRLTISSLVFPTVSRFAYLLM